MNIVTAAVEIMRNAAGRRARWRLLIPASVYPRYRRPGTALFSKIHLLQINVDLLIYAYVWMVHPGDSDCQEKIAIIFSISNL